MSDLTDRLDEIQARADAATEGSWDYYRPHYMSGYYSITYGSGADVAIEASEADAEFIAAARTDVPALVAALRAVLDVIGPHYATMLRREAKFGRTRSSCCCCEQCRAVQAIADALGVEP